MNRSAITKTFERIQSEGKKAFIPYIMAGDPSLEITRELVIELEEQGADIIELGVPFTDPLADGPTIQRASERALKNNVTLKSVMDTVAGLREKTSIPIVLMTYFNPVFKYGGAKFIDNAIEIGIDGIIIPDLPPDEERPFIRTACKKGLDIIFLLAPTSTEDRIKLVANNTGGFVYYVSVTGITGSRIEIDQPMKDMIALIKNLSKKPVAIGFGVKTPEEASLVSDIADGVIVGSSIVKKIIEDREGLSEYIRALRKAI